ncbi:MAG: adenylyl-sulfate kinase [Chloroflexi bacterium]|nr:adenylyl-sulfate kinase [Chloroflexota bacterium]
MSNLSAGFVVWITGLPASGKTSLAKAVHDLLADERIFTLILDAGDIRPLLTPKPEYTDAERRWFYQAIIGLAAQFARQGANVIIAATGNRRLYREQARRCCPVFAEVYLDCALDVCRSRDSTGQYNADTDYVPGIGVAYEPPFAPEVIVRTASKTPAQAAQTVIDILKLEGIIPREACNGNSQPISQHFSQPIGCQQAAPTV